MSKETRNRLIALFAIGIAYGSVYNPCYIRYLFYDAMLEALGCTNTQLAALNSFGAIVGIVTQLPGGWLADRFSCKKIVAISVFANLPLCVISVLFSKIYVVQLAVWFGFCLTGGFAFWPAALKAVRLSAPEDKQESTFGIFEAFQGGASMIGNFIAIGVFSMFVNQVAGYKAAMLSMGIYSAFGAFLMLFCYKEGTITDNTEPGSEPKVKSSGIADLLQVCKNPGTWLVGGVIIGAYGIYLAQSYFTSYFTGVLGAAVVFSATMSNIRQYGMKVVAGPTGGFFAAKLKSASKFDAIVLIVCVGLIIYVWNLTPETPNVINIATVFTLVLALFCLMGKGTMWATMEQAHIPREITGMAISVISYLGFTTTEAGVPFICGHFLDKYADDLAVAYDKIFTLLLVMACIGVVSAVLLVIYDKHMLAKEAKVSASEETIVL